MTEQLSLFTGLLSPFEKKFEFVLLLPPDERRLALKAYNLTYDLVEAATGTVILDKESLLACVVGSKSLTKGQQDLLGAMVDLATFDARQ